MASSDGSSSGGSFIGGLIGATIGFFIGGPAGAVKGFMYGSTAGGLLMPPTGPDQFGPRLDSLTLSTSSNTATLPRSYGTVAHKGNLIWAKDDEYVEVATVKKVKTGLFSKTKVTTYSYFFSGAYAFHKGEIEGVLRIWHAGGRDLVYNVTSSDTDTIVAGGELSKYITIYYGTADQMPDPLMSEDVGAASCSAYRGVFYIVYDMYPLENYQNNVGNLDPKVEYTTKTISAADLDHLVDIPADDADSEQDRFAGLHNATNMDADGVHLWRVGKGETTDAGRATPPGLSLTGEVYHYLAQPSGEMLLKQEYDDGLVILAANEEMWDPWTKACKGKSDRNVFASTRGVIKTGGSEDGGASSHPYLMIPANFLVRLGASLPVSVGSLKEAIDYVIATGSVWGDGIAYRYLFQTGDPILSTQTILTDDDEVTFVFQHIPGTGYEISTFTFEVSDPYQVFTTPITESMYAEGSSRFMRYEVRILDVENDTDTQRRVNVDASIEVPADQTYYAFYEDDLYFVYTYSDHYVIVKIEIDGSRSFASRTHATSESVVKIGILNDQLVVVLNNASACNLDLYGLDLTFVETKNAAYVATQFGASTSAIYNNISFDFDRVYYCRSGHMYYKDSLTATAVDMGLHTGLIDGDDVPALFNIFGVGNLIADSTRGGTMPNVGIQFFTYGLVTDPGKVWLSDIITSECALVSLEASDIGVTTIDYQVRGYTVSEIGSVRNPLGQLQAIFPYDIIQSGDKLKFVKRGLSSVATISWEDLGQGVSLVQDREMETQLPFRVELTYIDKDLNYQPNIQFSERPSDSKNIVRLNIPIVLTPDEAAQAVDVLHSIYFMERRSYAFTLPPTYRNLEPSDIITLAMKDVSYVVRLTNIHYLANGSMECTAKLHNDVVYTSYAVGASSPAIPDTIPSIANPILGVLDIPVIKDIQNKAGYTALVTHTSDTWIGGSMFRARDGVTYEQVQAFSTVTTWGTCIDTLAAHGGHVIDEGSTLTIKPFKGTPATVTTAQFLNEETLIAYGKPGRWELCAARDVVDNADGTFTLSYWMRGRRGTEQYTGTHVAGDYFGFVNDGSAKFVAALNTDIDQTLNHKAITTGRDLASASVVPLTYAGVNLTPLAPVQPCAVRDGSGNLTVTVIPRTRLNGGLTMLEQIYDGAPIGEASESYEMDILDTGVVVRTITATTPSFPYSAAQQTTDFGSTQASVDTKTYQISATVGRGYALEATV